MNKSIPLAASFIALAVAAVAQPAHMNYQGRLLDADGQPLPNASYSLEFNIYDSPDGGVPVWGPFTCDAVIANGRFNVILGTHDAAEPARPLSEAFEGDTRFVEIKVDDGDPILPRQQVLSAPYALQSQRARLADISAALVKDLADALCPAGSVVAFAGPATAVPDGWMLCDGRPLVATEYPRLFAVIGYAWGGSENLFNLPDLRGMFLRGVSGSAADQFADPDRDNRINRQAGGNTGNLVGSFQADEFESHTHSNKTRFIIDGSKSRFSGGSWGAFSEDPAINPTGGNETRPNNAYVHYIIKY